MDYIREFDIRLDREMYYAGEVVLGHIFLETVENFKLKCIRIALRGKAHAEWKAIVSGDQRNLEDDQYFMDERDIIFGKEKHEGSVPVLPRGIHQYPFKFQLPESSLPCSFESKPGYIRYYIKVTLDIPYASPPQGTKYFTIIGPHIDCMDEQYLKPVVGQDKKTKCCFCCERGSVVLRSQLLRSAYVCGESIKLKATIDNQGEEEVKLKVRLYQHVEYFIFRGVLGLSKEVSHLILELTGDAVGAHSQTKWDSADSLVVPIMPPSLQSSCKLIHIYYMLKVCLEFESKNDDLEMHFPITIATVPFRIPNSSSQPSICYDVASEHAEGGMYIAPEFLLGQVYDGITQETIVLYRPVYIAIRRSQQQEEEEEENEVRNTADAPGKISSSISASRLNCI